MRPFSNCGGGDLFTKITTKVSASAGICRWATKEEDAMRKWSRPTVVEISVGMEINCYACAEI